MDTSASAATLPFRTAQKRGQHAGPAQPLLNTAVQSSNAAAVPQVALLSPLHRLAMETHPDEKKKGQPVLPSNLPVSTQNLLASPRLTVTAQQNEDDIEFVQLFVPAAAEAVMNESINQTAAKIRRIPLIPSHPAKGAARNRMRNGKQTERQKAGEKQRRDSETSEQREKWQEMKIVRMTKIRTRAGAKSR